jgi:hypothetical protein
MTYSDKAFEIVKRSINSAVFIDEKALEFYSTEPKNPGIIEHQLSTDLYNSFKSDGVSLVVHKFQNSDLSDDNIKSYLFKDRDLVLLDWKLEGKDGEEYSLELLSDIIAKPYIHFCTIYTSESENRLVEVFQNILSYFSNGTKAYYGELEKKIEAEFSEDEIRSIKPFLDEINLYRNDKTKLPNCTKNILKYISRIKLITGENDLIEASIKISIALMDTHKAMIAQPSPNVVSFDNQTLVINNTVIILLNKSENQPNVIIKKLSERIEKETYSFTQLLGLEMRSTFKEGCSFIDDNLLKVTPEAFFTHRTHLINNSKEKKDTSFKLLIKNVLTEQATIKLGSAKLSLFDDSFLNEQSEIHKDKTPSPESMIAMNIFYNSVKYDYTEGLCTKKLDFGDLFEDDGIYYLCITTLCDCLRPENIKNNYYFVIGKPIDIELALTLGDRAFISFIPNNKAVSWILPEGDNDEYESSLPSDEGIELLKERIIKLGKINKGLKHKPLYIKPQPYNVRNSKIKDGTIEIRRIETIEKEDSEKDHGDIVFDTVKYITTIKSNYTQRIANHAFTHPLRVGIDFISKR